MLASKRRGTHNGAMSDDQPTSYTKDPKDCDHSRLSTRGLGGIRGGEVDTVLSDWSTCLDCGERVPNPLSNL
jgi:hypothetical protein